MSAPLAEVNINREGNLDIDDATLAALDVVGIAVHSHFSLPHSAMTERLVRAMRNTHADILFHPTGRIIGKREAYDVDMDAVIAAGVPIVVDSDAHSVEHLAFPREHGVDQARRGWATAADVLNTRPVDEFLAALKGGGQRPPRTRRR